MNILGRIAPDRVILKPSTNGRNEPPDLRVFLGPVPIPYTVEAQHIVTIGASGSGKTQAFESVVAVLMQRPRDRLVILDPESNLFTKLGQPCDTVVNIFDARCPGLSLSHEMLTEEDSPQVALAFVPPVPEGGQAEEWTGYGRTLVEAVMTSSPNAPPSELYRRFFISSPAELAKLVETTPARRIFEPGAERMLASVLAVLASRLGYLRYLRDPAPETKPFTFTGWAREAPPGARLFLTYTVKQKRALFPLYNAGLSLLISEMLSQPPVPQPPTPGSYKRTWIIGDELGLLGRIAGIEDAVTNGRRFGLTVMAGFQDIHQPRHAYGANLAGSLLNSFGTWLVMAQNDGESAEYFSRALGNQQIRRRLTSTSRGTGREFSQHQITTNEQIATEPLVLAGELLHLPNLTGFLRVRGDPLLHKITLPVMTWWGARLEPFIRRPTATLPPPPARLEAVNKPLGVPALDFNFDFGDEALKK